ncbi:MAG: hypothetical protein QNJ40_16500 [Xanthomonadales bacterium]|nr:hypothetical protein [Xanthomonadales bacterium]
MTRNHFMAALLFAVAANSSFASVVLDQNHVPSPPTLDVAGNVGQTFIAGRTGHLVQLDVGLECSPGGQVRFDLYQFDAFFGNWMVRDTVDRDSGTFPITSGPVPQRYGVALPPLWVSAGKKLAFVMAFTDTDCRYDYDTSGTYPDGQMILRLGVGFGNISDDLDSSFDMDFATYISQPSNRLCRYDLYGPPDERVPAYVPICGCLSAVAINALMCRFDLPELVLFREIPLFENEGFARYSILPFRPVDQVQIEDEGIAAFQLEGLSQHALESVETSYERSGEAFRTITIHAGDQVYEFQVPDQPVQ